MSPKVFMTGGEAKGFESCTSISHNATTAASILGKVRLMSSSRQKLVKTFYSRLTRSFGFVIRHHHHKRN